MSAAERLQSALRRDDWLTVRLGVPSYRAEVGGREDWSALRSDLARLEAGSFVDAKVPVHDVPAQALLGRLDFRLVSTSVRLTRAPLGALRPEDGRVRDAVPEDRFAVAALAERAFSSDRFHSDPELPNGAGDRIKHDWAEGYFDGTRGDAMAVAGPVGAPYGFVQLLLRNESLIVDLVAVDPAVRGRGVGRALLAYALARWPATAGAEVGTQLANVPSLRLYEGIGFRFTSAEHVWHWRAAK